MRPLGRAALVAAAYTALALCLTWPLCLDLSSGTLGEPNVDKLNNLWDFWWWSRALGDSELSFLSSAHINYPPGVDLWRSNSGPLLYLVSLVPWALTRDLEATYNLMVLLSMLVSCLGGYALGHRLTDHRGVAFYLGTLSGFNALALLQVQVAIPELVNLGWSMLFMAALVRLQARRDLRSLCLALLWYLVAATWAWYLGFLLLGVALLFFMVHAGPARLLEENRRLLVLGLCLLVLCGAFAGWALGKLSAPGAGRRLLPVQAEVTAALADEEVRLSDEFGVLAARTRALGILQSPADRECVDAFELKLFTSVDPAAALVASDPGDPQAPFWPVRWAVPLVLALLGGLALRDRRALFFGGLALGCGALALGPCLVLGDEVLWGSCAWTPLSLMGNLAPGLARMQFPYRLLFPGVVGLLALSALGLHAVVTAPGRGRTTGLALVGAATLFGLCQGADASIFLRASHPNHPLMISAIPHPRFYDGLASAPGDIALLEVPFAAGAAVQPTYPLSRHTYLQTVHGKRIFSGPVPAYLAPRQLPADLATDPLLGALTKIQQGGHAPLLTGAEAAASRATLRKYRFQHVVLHRDDLAPAAFDRARTLLDWLLGAPRRDGTLPSDRLLIYTVPVTARR